MSIGKRSVELGALVPYCGYNRPKPYVERVERRRRPDGLVLTMFVRFPPKPNKGGCLWVEVGVSQWVKLGRKVAKIELYDGSTSPPVHRSRVG